MTAENKPISGLYPLTGALTPNDLLVISQEEPEGWQSYNAPVGKFVDLVIQGMNDGSVFLRKVHTVDDSGLVGSGTIIDAMGIDWSKLDTRYAPNDVGGGYVPKTTLITAGAGLTGGGALDSNRTISMGSPSTITDSTNNSVNGETHTHAIERASLQNAGVVKLNDSVNSDSVTEAATAKVVKSLYTGKADKATTVTAGNGLAGGGTLGGSFTMSLGVPSAITESSTNSSNGSTHTHAIDTATTARAGIVKLNDGFVSSSVVEAATAKAAKALNDNKADKNTAINVGWGLSGGGNLTGDRSIDLNLSQLDTRYAAAGVGGSYVPLTRTISAGTGLVGGGALSNNLTFSVTFGTTVNTVAMGNDSRIVNGQSAFTWGNHADQSYLKLVSLKPLSGLLGQGTTGAPLEIDFSILDGKYFSKNGGTIDGDVTINGKLNAPGLDTGIPLGSMMWFNCPRSALPDGYVAADGQLGDRVTFPEIWNMINTGRLNRVTEAAWQQLSDTQKSSQRACYSLGTNTTNFRFPDINGKQPGSWKSPVLRGDGYTFGGPGMNSNGYILGDTIRNITGTIRAVIGPWKPDGATDVFTVENRETADLGSAGWDDWARVYRFDASKVVPTSDENRPVSAFGVWAIKAKGGTSTVPLPGSPATLMSNIFNGSQKIIGDNEVTGKTTTKDLEVTGNFNLAPGQYLPGMARAICNFDGEANKIRYSKGVSSVVNLGGGAYEVTLSEPMPSTDYVVVATPSNHGYWGHSACSLSILRGFAKTTTKFRLIATYGGDNTQGVYDVLYVNFAVFY